MSDAITRFREQVDDRHSCWLWTGKLTNTGYASFNATYEGQTFWKAHRFAYRVFKGPIPKGMCVLHTCDNRFCVNPDHLHLGTPADNAKQRESRGRGTHGELNGRAKITEQDVRDIRNSTESCSELARRYGLHDSHIGRIRTREKWAHVE